MCGVEKTVSLFFNNVSKIIVANQMITDHNAIYKLFGYGIYQKPHYIFKSKAYEFYSRKIGLFSGNYTRMTGYFIVIHRDMRIRKELIAQFIMKNSTLFHSTHNFPKKYHILKIIKIGIGSMLF